MMGKDWCNDASIQIEIQNNFIVSQHKATSHKT